MLNRFKSIDLYPKLADDVRVKTFSGAAVSIIAAVCILGLFISELLIYLTPDRVDRLQVDTSRGEKLPIFVDVTFHSLPCQLLSLQAMDVAGSNQETLTHSFRKTPLDRSGRPLDQGHEYALGQDIVLFGSSAEHSMRDGGVSPCGSCYGLESTAGECCNTCKELIDRANKSNRKVQEHLWTPCIVERSKTLASELARGDGCRISGRISVNKVAGNLYLLPGRHADAAAAVSAASIDASRLNFHHKINSLAFGRKYDGIANPLDGVGKTDPPQSTTNAASGTTTRGMFMYYAKVIPTEYTDNSGQLIETNQFSVTEHTKALQVRPDATTQKTGPGVFIFYELSPIRIKATRTRPPFLHFITQLCAIIGGVFTVAGMVDRFIYAGMSATQRRVQLGAKGQ